LAPVANKYVKTNSAKELNEKLNITGQLQCHYAAVHGEISA